MAVENYEYTTINGHERYAQIESNDFIVDFKQFILEDSDTVSFSLGAIMKLLPYDGFYPQERTKQIAGIFNSVYFYESDEVDKEKKYDEDQSIVDETKNKILAITQPLFAPGILFNTIKSGIAVDWPVAVLNESDDYRDLYLTSDKPKYPIGSSLSDYNDKMVSELSGRLPFESIIEPMYEFDKLYRILQRQESYGANINVFYLNPSHYKLSIEDKFSNLYLNETKKTPNCSFETIKNISNSSKKKKIYNYAINNFLYETVNFFLQDNKLTSFRSNFFDVNQKIGLENNKRYALNVKIKKNKNFSMFNKNIKNISENNGTPSLIFIPSASLFGPPCSGYDENENNLNSSDSISYNPFTPPYFRNNEEDIITLYFDSGDSTEYSIEEIIQNLKQDNLPSGGSGPAFFYRMNLDSCLNLKLIYKREDGKTSWYIQTKFETPLINFSKCSYISGSLLAGDES